MINPAVAFPQPEGAGKVPDSAVIVIRVPTG
jgi:hypothetical protein